MSRAVKVEQLWPLLLVSDIRRSVMFYRDTLGFEVVGRAGEGNELHWCRLRRGGASVMLQQSESEDPLATTSPIALYFVCDDADEMHRELARRGMELDAPSTAYYGMRQLFVPEPDGYAICFESRTDQWVEVT